MLTTMSYQTLARRLRLHYSRLGITKAKKKSDMCACCTCSDHNVFPALTKDVHELRMCICNICHSTSTRLRGAFMIWKAMVACSGSLNTLSNLLATSSSRWSTLKRPCKHWPLLKQKPLPGFVLCVQSSRSTKCMSGYATH